MLKKLQREKDRLWFLIWLLGTLFVVIWDLNFLESYSFDLVIVGFYNTFTIAIMVIVFTLCLGWTTTVVLNYLDTHNIKIFYVPLKFTLDIIRSIPQIVGILLGYVFLALLMEERIIQSEFIIKVYLAFVMSIFIFNEMIDLMRDRIAHFKKLDFYNALRICGVKENRIVNFDILWKNSRIHIFNKLISIFGIAIFLQCSIDFIVSVGLTKGVNGGANLPTTLGSLLANIQSKEDIQAIGHTLLNPTYIPDLFTRNLQGVTVAFVIVFTILSVYQISNGYAERHRL